jgi:hypothetical protein
MFGNLVVDHTWVVHAIDLKVIPFLEKLRASRLDVSLEVILMTYLPRLYRPYTKSFLEFSREAEMQCEEEFDEEFEDDEKVIIILVLYLQLLINKFLYDFVEIEKKRKKNRKCTCHLLNRSSWTQKNPESAVSFDRGSVCNSNRETL